MAGSLDNQVFIGCLVVIPREAFGKRQERHEGLVFSLSFNHLPNGLIVYPPIE